jgi:hypothetical protein
MGTREQKLAVVDALRANCRSTDLPAALRPYPADSGAGMGLRSGASVVDGRTPKQARSHCSAGQRPTVLDDVERRDLGKNHTLWFGLRGSHVQRGFADPQRPWVFTESKGGVSWFPFVPSHHFRTRVNKRGVRGEAGRAGVVQPQPTAASPWSDRHFPNTPAHSRWLRRTSSCCHGGEPRTRTHKPAGLGSAGARGQRATQTPGLVEKKDGEGVAYAIGVRSAAGWAPPPPHPPQTHDHHNPQANACTDVWL